MQIQYALLIYLWLLFTFTVQDVPASIAAKTCIIVITGIALCKKSHKNHWGEILKNRKEEKSDKKMAREKSNVTEK